MTELEGKVQQCIENDDEVEFIKLWDRYKEGILTKIYDHCNTGVGLNLLAYCYGHGHGVEQDYEKAVELYQMAVNQGNSTAMNNLGYRYEHGRGVKQNYDKAIELYLKFGGVKKCPAILDKCNYLNLLKFIRDEKIEIDDQLGRKLAAKMSFEEFIEFGSNYHKYLFGREREMMEMVLHQRALLRHYEAMPPCHECGFEGGPIYKEGLKRFERTQNC